MSSKGRWKWVGSSVRGPAHVATGCPNQDDWKVKLVRGSLVAAVCDGLGSAIESDRGAREGCRAVCRAARVWLKKPGAPVELLLRLIHDFWSIGIFPHGRHECATTCLLVIGMTNQRAVFAQLGDGMIWHTRADGTLFELADARQRSFGNQTTGLGIATSMKEWTVQIIERVSPGDRFVLATDGVADDLVAEQKPAFAAYLGCLCDRKKRSARMQLERDLHDWPVPHHTDDKTLVVISLETDGDSLS